MVDIQSEQIEQLGGRSMDSGALQIYQSQLGKHQEAIQSYVWVTLSNRCWETRGLSKQQQDEVALDQYENPIRDLSEYLNNWQSVEAKL